jgi:hypothetical protein
MQEVIYLSHVSKSAVQLSYTREQHSSVVLLVVNVLKTHTSLLFRNFSHRVVFVVSFICSLPVLSVHYNVRMNKCIRPHFCLLASHEYNHFIWFRSVCGLSAGRYNRYRRGEETGNSVLTLEYPDGSNSLVTYTGQRYCYQKYRRDYNCAFIIGWMAPVILPYVYCNIITPGARNQIWHICGC